MNKSKLITNILSILLILSTEGILIFSTCEESRAAFDTQGVRLFKDNNICINEISSGMLTVSGLNLADLQTNSDSVQSRISSGGSFCSAPPFFTGGALLTTANGITIQAQPTVQSLGRGILISEVAGAQGGVSSSGDPTGFSSLVTRIGGLSGLTTTIFEINLPQGCDVVDDDNDVVGASTDLSVVNDFSFPTCTSTNGLTVQCNSEVNLLMATNGLVPASGNTPAKIHFAISAINTVADNNMIDSILLRLDSQDIFCPTTISGPLTATIIAKNAVDSPTITETIGTVDIGTPTKTADFKYETNTATSQKGEVSSNEVNTTPVLAGSTNTEAHKIQIEELDNESIPIGGQSSAILINPNSTSTAENNIINLWITPSVSGLFNSPPSSQDISISDNSLILNSSPYIVMGNSDDLNAPFGTLVIPLRKNPTGIDPSTTKTKISINNLKLSSSVLASSESFTVSLTFFEPTSGAIVNTPGVLSINNSTNMTNPQNFSAFSANSTRALAQNAVVSGAVNEPTGADQITTNADLSALTNRNTTLGTPQIKDFVKTVSEITPPDTNKITVSNSNSVLTITGTPLATIGGAKVKIESFSGTPTSVFDSVTIISKSDGSFISKLQGDFSMGNVNLNFTQIVSGTESSVVSKAVSQGSTSDNLSCEQTVCGCENLNCTPTIPTVLVFVANNGGLSEIVSKGGATLTELINAIKKTLGLS